MVLDLISFVLGMFCTLIMYFIFSNLKNRNTMEFHETRKGWYLTTEHFNVDGKSDFLVRLQGLNFKEMLDNVVRNVASFIG